MRSKAAITTFLTALVLLAASPAYAASRPGTPEPRGDNSPWVAVIFVVVVAGVVGFLLFLANAYRRNNNRQH
jgi:hypothetical protein